MPNEERADLKHATQATVRKANELAAFLPEGAAPLDPLLRRAQVEALTGLSTSALYRLLKNGEFPKPVQITQGAVGWKHSQVADWISSRPEADV